MTHQLDTTHTTVNRVDVTLLRSNERQLLRELAYNPLTKKESDAKRIDLIQVQRQLNRVQS